MATAGNGLQDMANAFLMKGNLCGDTSFTEMDERFTKLLPKLNG
jgi:hypothetical protein